MKILFRT